jgi:hypothetical protein
VLFQIDFGDENGARALSSASFPNLSVLEISGDQGPKAFDEYVQTLARSPLFERLKSLRVSDGRVTDDGIRAIATSPAAKILRSLDVGTNAFGEEGLMTIAEPEAFPNLTTLRLGTAGIESRNTTPEAVARFLRVWEGRSLRHLDLNYWNLGNGGAEALAKNPAFSGLRWLNLNYTGDLGREGLRAIAESPHLNNLICLSFQGVPAERAADLLLDPALLPNLAACYFPFATTAKKKKLAEARPWVRWDHSR